MKRITLYIILFSYSMVMFKPVMPYFSDAVAHIFYYTQHMATVHYQNGKFHVHKELVDNAKKNGSSKETPASKKENSANDHIIVKQSQPTEILPLPVSYQIPAAPKLLTNFLAADYLPPRV